MKPTPNTKNMPFIPAAPGFFVIDPVTGEDGRVMEGCKLPIIGFMIDEWAVLPVSPVRIYEGDTAVMTPAGLVMTREGEFDSIEAWIARQNRNHSDEKQVEAA